MKMTQERFFEEVRNEVLNKIRDEGFDVSAELQTVTKTNGVEFHGIAIKENDNSIAPLIYIDSFYDKYNDNVEIDEIVSTVSDMYFLSKKNASFDVSMLSSFDAAKDHITTAIVNTKLNETILNELVHRDFVDLSLIYRVEFDMPDGSGFGAVKITNELMKVWNATPEEIHEVALKNTKTKYKTTCRDLLDIVRDMNSVDDESDISTGMYVLTNDKNTNGAALIYSDFHELDRIAEAMKSDLIVLPCSKNEVILISADEAMDIDILRAMVTEINESDSVTNEDFLSNNVYYFNRSQSVLEIA